VVVTDEPERPAPDARSDAHAGSPVEGAARERDPYRLAAGLLCALHAVVLLGLVVFYFVELGLGASDDATRVVMSALLILVFAVLLGVLARGWLRGDNWPNTPTIVWNILLLPVAWSLVTGGKALIGVPLLVLAFAGVVVAARAKTTSEPDQD
jgi:O-antigen/teichoic acid export membrane protein